MNKTYICELCRRCFPVIFDSNMKSVKKNLLILYWVVNLPIECEQDFSFTLSAMIYGGMIENNLTRINICNFPQSSLASLISLEHIQPGSCYCTLARSCSCIEPSLAFATRPTSTHQRVTWPELYRKFIGFLHIVVWQRKCPLTC